MTNSTLPARDVAFLTALAEFLLASGSDRAADLIYSGLDVHARSSGPSAQEATNRVNRRIRNIPG